MLDCSGPGTIAVKLSTGNSCMLHCNNYCAKIGRKCFSTQAFMDRLKNIAARHKHPKGILMSTLPEQFSAVRKSQVEAQINFFQNYSAKSLESMQKMFALNLSVSRASLEKSTAAVTALLSVKDPRDLLALTNNSQENFNGLLAYGRELFAIATGAALANAAVAATPAVHTPALKIAAPEAAAFSAPEVQAEPEAEPVAIVAAPEVALPVEEKPIAKAVSKVASTPLIAKPVAAPVPQAEPLAVEVAQQQLELPAARSKKKQ
jgi:phasin family protein